MYLDYEAKIFSLADLPLTDIPLRKTSLRNQGELKYTIDEEANTHIVQAFDASRSRPDKNILAPRQDDGYQSFVLGGFPNPTSTASSAIPSATGTSVCPAGNGTVYTSDAGIVYQIVCDIDYRNNDYPFEMVDTFASCVQKCDAYNFNAHQVKCVAALFIASRDEDANDCYLKSSTNRPTQ